ncbi:hypothetical protein AVEN_151634-1 [Araneus ventricosus]|uniref:Uncharacterized protein n=1 Tax=Araneus ventricosus TaxID=182803 RepID=A0A4Y2N2M5_ARAVE|nr:hypothetical protein AVEN_151634-1 [Araneus ventricosus]
MPYMRVFEFHFQPQREVPFLADPLMCRYPRIEVPNWNRRMEFWILFPLEFHHFQSFCSRFHRFSTLTIVFPSCVPKIPKWTNGEWTALRLVMRQSSVVSAGLSRLR